MRNHIEKPFPEKPFFEKGHFEKVHFEKGHFLKKVNFEIGILTKKNF